jgi:hypothetical protein
MVRVLLFSLVFCGVSAFGQNLVSNPSFEVYSECPTGSDEVHLAEGWQKLDYTSDYYNCDYTSSQIDTLGQDGTGFIGMSCLRPGWSDSYREYVSRYLDSSLTAGVTYYVEFWVKLEGDKCVSTDAFGALFTQGEPERVDSWTSLLPYTPQIENPQYNQIDNTWEWKKICGSFVAEGGENFITLGSFKSDEESTFTLIDTATCQGGKGVHWSYILLDNIIVTSVESATSACIDSTYAYPENVIFPDGELENQPPPTEYSECLLNDVNIITPNYDNLNDFLYLDISQSFTFRVMNRWGDLVFESFEKSYVIWRGENMEGQDLNDGQYFYVIEDHINQCRQQGTITIVR